jgi:hypothetical protein
LRARCGKSGRSELVAAIMADHTSEFALPRMASTELVSGLRAA